MTFFADRKFYDDFWNCSTFAEFSRKWNRPVHLWLLRHVYLDAMRRYGASRSLAQTVTFAVSIVVHEAVLWGAFRRVTFPYLGLFSLTQLPLADLMRIEVIQGRRLGNLLFWGGLTFGISLITVLYAKELDDDTGSHGGGIAAVAAAAAVSAAAINTTTGASTLPAATPCNCTC